MHQLAVPPHGSSQGYMDVSTYLRPAMPSFVKAVLVCMNASGPCSQSHALLSCIQLSFCIALPYPTRGSTAAPVRHSRCSRNSQSDQELIFTGLYEVNSAHKWMLWMSYLDQPALSLKASFNAWQLLQHLSSGNVLLALSSSVRLLRGRLMLGICGLQARPAITFFRYWITWTGHGSCGRARAVSFANLMISSRWHLGCTWPNHHAHPPQVFLGCGDATAIAIALACVSPAESTVSTDTWLRELRETPSIFDRRPTSSFAVCLPTSRWYYPCLYL